MVLGALSNDSSYWIIEFGKSSDPYRYTLFIYWFCITLILILCKNIYKDTVLVSFHRWKPKFHKPKSSKPSIRQKKSLPHLYITTFTLIQVQYRFLKQQTILISQQKLSLLFTMYKIHMFEIDQGFYHFYMVSYPSNL